MKNINSKFSKEIQFNVRMIDHPIPSCSRVDSAVSDFGGYPVRYLEQMQERDRRMGYDG